MDTFALCPRNLRLMLDSRYPSVLYGRVIGLRGARLKLSDGLCELSDPSPNVGQRLFLICHQSGPEFHIVGFKCQLRPLVKLAVYFGAKLVVELGVEKFVSLGRFKVSVKRG